MKYYLYNIKAKPNLEKLDEMFVNSYCKGLYRMEYDNILLFNSEPTEEDIIDLLKLLRPNSKYYLGSVKISFIREIKKEEL